MHDTNHLILVNDQLDAFFFNVFISTPLHVSSSKYSSSGGPTCINTPSGIIELRRDVRSAKRKTNHLFYCVNHSFVYCRIISLDFSLTNKRGGYFFTKRKFQGLKSIFVASCSYFTVFSDRDYENSLSSSYVIRQVRLSL